MTEREHAAHKVQKLSFFMLDAAMFLNSHPSDSAALNFFRKTRQEYQKAAASYEQHFGPLSLMSAGGSSWDWVCGPWPWEGVK